MAKFTHNLKNNKWCIPTPNVFQFTDINDKYSFTQLNIQTNGKEERHTYKVVKTYF